MCRDMCVDMCVDMCRDMCRDVCVGMYKYALATVIMPAFVARPFVRAAAPFRLPAI